MTSSGWIAAAVVALCGAAMVLFATASGVGVSPDSVAYIGAARGLLQGLGLASPLPEGHYAPLVYYAPLFPTLLAGGGLLGIDPLTGARWLNSALFAATILLSAHIIESDTGSIASALFGSTLLLITFPLLMVHSMAWSEPAFVFLSLLALLWLSRYVGGGRSRDAAAAAAAIGLAMLFRYAGVFLIGVGLVVILTASRPGRRERVRDCGLLIVISGLLTSLWLSRNWMVTGTLTDRPVAFHPVTLAQLQRGVETIAGWLRIEPTPRRLTLAVVALAAVAFVLHRATRRRLLTPAARRGGTSSPVAATALIFIAGYAVFLPIASSFLDASFPLDDRILSPLLAWALVGGVCGGYWSATDPQRRRWVRPAVVVIGAWFAVAQLLHTVPWLFDVHRSGQGYATTAWQRSEILARVRDLPPDTRIFSNGDDAIYLLTGRLAERIPEQTSPATAEVNDLYEAELDYLRRRVAESPLVIVYFSRMWRSNLVSIATLQQHMSLQTLYADPDGIIYAARAAARAE